MNEWAVSSSGETTQRCNPLPDHLGGHCRLVGTRCAPYTCALGTYNSNRGWETTRERSDRLNKRIVSACLMGLLLLGVFSIVVIMLLLTGVIHN